MRKGFEITVEADENYIRCKVFVDISIPIAIQFTEELDKLAKEKGIKRIFMDLRSVVNIAGAGENYKFSRTEVHNLKPQDNYVAMLISEGDHSHDFVETVSQNAGYGVRLFTNEAEALAWLLHPLHGWAYNEFLAAPYI